jgi:hypothetical protein
MRKEPDGVKNTLFEKGGLGDLEQVSNPIYCWQIQ